MRVVHPGLKPGVFLDEYRGTPPSPGERVTFLALEACAIPGSLDHLGPVHHYAVDGFHLAEMFCEREDPDGWWSALMAAAHAGAASFLADNQGLAFSARYVQPAEHVACDAFVGAYLATDGFSLYPTEPGTNVYTYVDRDQNNLRDQSEFVDFEFPTDV
ncbi:MAG: hypothetical protein R3B07_19365 [Polyangiaceae bacterium]